MVLVLAAPLTFLLATSAQDQVANPEYQAWSKVKVGSSVTLKMQSDSPAGQRSPVMVTLTLEKIADDKVELLSKAEMYADGQKVQTMKTSEERAAKVDAKAVPKSIKEGDETLDLGGKKVKCRWKETEGEWERQKAKIKTWWSDEIPGGIAKRIITPAAAAGVTHVVTAWEKK